MSQLDFILITNFGHQAISQTKKDFAYYLEDNTDILHYRRMPGTGFELIVPRWQKASVVQQLRQLQFTINTEYHPTNAMVRRRRDESTAQAREREAYCAHRAFKKVADADRTNPVVRAWFQCQVDKVEAAYPNVFEPETHNRWMQKIVAESMARRAEADKATEEHGDSGDAPKGQGDSDDARANNSTDETTHGKKDTGDGARMRSARDAHGKKDIGDGARTRSARDAHPEQDGDKDHGKTHDRQGQDDTIDNRAPDAAKNSTNNARETALPAAK